MKAVLMAGGEGTRLRPLTSTQPKPMVPLANRPLAEHVIRLLKAHGFDEIIVTVAFHATALQTFFGDGAELGVRLAYAAEEAPLGTAGSVRNAMEHLDEPFLVVSGDVLTDIDLSAVVAAHEAHRPVATIAVMAMENPVDFGVVVTGDDGSIERFLEKPTWSEVISDTVNTGIYVLEPEVFAAIPDGPADFASEVFPGLLAQGHRLQSWVASGHWQDVGTLEAYLRAHRDVLDRTIDVAVPGFRLGGGVWLGEGSEIDPAAQIRGPALIGDHCRIEAGAVLGEYTVLGANVRVGADASIERSVVHDNVYLGPGVHLRGAVVGRSSDLRRGARLEEGAVLGDGCFVGEHAVVNAGVKVYPHKTVEHGAVVNTSIVWGSRGARNLFGRRGVAGLANVDVSPELAVRLAMAYGTTMPRGSTVVASRDTSRAARVLKRALEVGLNSAGVDVADLEVATVPVTRFAVRNERAAGGVTVRLDPDDPQSVSIRFFDADGTDLGEAARKKIERLYQREDTRRSLAGEIGDQRHPLRTVEAYTTALVEGVDLDAVRGAGFRLVLDYAYGSAGFVMPNVLAKLGAEVLAVNPYASTRQALAFDRRHRAQGVSDLVRASGASLGAVVDPAGERLTVVDDTGTVLSDTDAMVALLTLLLHDAHPPATHRRRIGLPVSVGRAVEAMCAAAGADVAWAKLAGGHVAEPTAGDLAFAADAEGGFVFPAFLPGADGVAALVHLLEWLARSGRRLSEVRTTAPQSSVAHEAVVTPWDKRGLVMRVVLEEATGHETLLVDGVKVVDDDGWVLVVPDPEEPMTHVWAEAGDDDEAQARAEASARRIRNLLRA